MAGLPATYVKEETEVNCFQESMVSRRARESNTSPGILIC